LEDGFVVADACAEIGEGERDFEVQVFNYLFYGF
jgi:hypothetical protein